MMCRVGRGVTETTLTRSPLSWSKMESLECSDEGRGKSRVCRRWGGGGGRGNIRSNKSVWDEMEAAWERDEEVEEAREGREGGSVCTLLLVYSGPGRVWVTWHTLGGPWGAHQQDCLSRSAHFLISLMWRST